MDFTSDLLHGLLKVLSGTHCAVSTLYASRCFSTETSRTASETHPHAIITRSGTESSIQDKTSRFILLDLIKRVNTSLSIQKNKKLLSFDQRNRGQADTSAQKHPQLIIITDRELNQTNFFQSFP